MTVSFDNVEIADTGSPVLSTGMESEATSTRVPEEPLVSFGDIADNPEHWHDAYSDSSVDEEPRPRHNSPERPPEVAPTDQPADEVPLEKKTTRNRKSHRPRRSRDPTIKEGEEVERPSGVQDASGNDERTELPGRQQDPVNGERRDVPRRQQIPVNGERREVPGRQQSPVSGASRKTCLACRQRYSQNVSMNDPGTVLSCVLRDFEVLSSHSSVVGHQQHSLVRELQQCTHELELINLARSYIPAKDHIQLHSILRSSCGHHCK